MILTEEKTYIINVTEVDTDAELGLNKKDIMIKYTNLELLHAVLASTMPYGRLSARYRGKRKAELQSRIAMVESVLETRGDQLAKAEQIMYLDREKCNDGFSQVTPRFLEMVASGCNIIARYKTNADTDYYELEKFCQSINTYEEFEKEMDKCRIKGPDMTFYSSYLKKHYTSKRVEELQVILNEIDW